MKTENSANNLEDLNNILFTTLRGYIAKSVDKEHAQTVSNIGNTIINNAKAQLAFYRQAGVRPPHIFTQPIALNETNPAPKKEENRTIKEFSPKEVQIDTGDCTPEEIQAYLKHKKYLNTAEAIVVESRLKFIENVKAHAEKSL